MGSYDCFGSLQPDTIWHFMDLHRRANLRGTFGRLSVRGRPLGPTRLLIREYSPPRLEAHISSTVPPGDALSLRRFQDQTAQNARGQVIILSLRVPSDSGPPRWVHLLSSAQYLPAILTTRRS